MSFRRLTTVEPHPPGQKGQFHWRWYSCQGIYCSCPVGVSSSQRLTTVESHPPAQKGAIFFAMIVLCRHPAAWLECPADRDLPLWKHIHLRKRGNFYWWWYSCPGCPAAQLECPLVRDSSLWNHIHLHQRSNYICCGISSGHGITVNSSSCPVGMSFRRLTTVEPHPPGQKGQFYWRWYSCQGIYCSCPVGVSSRQRLTTVESHPSAKIGNVISSVFLSRHPAAQLECPPDTGILLWNHIRMYKMAILSSVVLLPNSPTPVSRSSSCPVGVSSSQRLTTVESHPSAQKRQFYLPVHVRASSCPTEVSSKTKRYHCGTTSTCAKGEILFAMVFRSIHPAAGYRVSSCQRLTTVDSVCNNIHLSKRVYFICSGILLKTFCCPVGVSSSQKLITVESHPPAQKGAIFFAMIFHCRHPAARLECPAERDSPL